MKKHIKILLLEDRPLDAELIKRQLVKSHLDFEMLVVDKKAKFELALHYFGADIILSDHSLPDFNSHEALLMIKESGIIVPFILITSTMTDEFAVKVMQEGAHDYIIKDRLLRLPSAIANLVEKFGLAREQREERLKANEDMKFLNHRLSLATKSANIGVWDWNLATNELTWDDTMNNIFSIRADDLSSGYEAWLKRLHPDDAPDVKACLKRAVAGIEKYDTEFRIIIQNDQIRYIRASGIVEHDSGGKPIRMIGINWDITKRKKASKERDVIINDLVQRNVALEQFAYIISHNLRVPIANIIGATDSLSDVETSVDDMQILVNGLKRSALKLDDVVKDLNTILEVNGEKCSREETVYFADLVDEIKQSIQEVISCNNVIINHNFSAIGSLSTLKPYAYSIFFNLITNSIKYRQKNLPCIINIRSEKVDNKLALYFTDNGIGINTEKYGDDIFGLYKRFHTQLDGKGMGLFMVKTQVEKLKGKISVTSIENQQTEFKIVFDQS